MWQGRISAFPLPAQADDAGNDTRTTTPEGADENTLLLVQVNSAGNIVEQTGDWTVSTTGTVIVDTSVTHDGYGSIRNTASGSITPAGYSYLDGLSITLSGDFCIEGWCKLLDSSYNLPALWLGGGSGQFIYYPQSSSSVITAFSSIYSSTSYDTGWHHVAVSRSDSTVRLFIDGTMVGSGTDSSTPAFSFLRFGGTGSGSYVPCCWENIRVSDVARYTSSFSPPGRF
jgi:hypothetical protein